MATKLSKPTLNQLFSDGERPTGDNFESAWMSFLNQKDDQISYNSTNNNIELGPNTGLVLGNPTVGVTAGTLRFNSGTGTIQFYNGSAFKDIAGGAGAFVQVGTGPAVAFSGGNVGIGTTSTVPTHRLEIPLENNTAAGDPNQEILLGNLVVHNGPSTASGAYIVNNNALVANPTVSTVYALFQDGNGKTIINGSSNSNQSLALAIDGTAIFVIDQFGAINVSGDMTMGTNTAPNNLVVFGNGFKPGGGSWGDSSSDIRVKKNLRPFKEGLQKVLAFNPVVYNFNGKGGTPDNNKDYVGLIAQDVKEIMPELTISKSVKLNQDDSNETEILTHDLSQLTFVFINAFKELSVRLEKLEKSNKNAN